MKNYTIELGQMTKNLCHMTKVVATPTVGSFGIKFCMKAYGSTGMKNYTTELGQMNKNLGHMTKVVATPMCGKNPLKIFSSTSGPIAIELGM